MAFASVGSLGSVNSQTNNQATLVLTTTAALQAGNLGVIIIAVDNHGTTDADHSEVTGVVDSAGNTWEKGGEFTNGQGSAQSGATVSVWFKKVAIELALGGTITVSFSNSTSRDAAAATAREYTVTGTVSVDVTATLATDSANDPGSLNATTANAERLRIRGWAREDSGSSFSPTTNWTAFTDSGGGTSSSGMAVGGEFRINTATSAASNPDMDTGEGSADMASVYVALVEASGTAYTLTADVGTFTLTGIAALQKITMNAVKGVYTLTGIDAIVKKALTMVGDAGAYTYTGVDSSQQISGLSSPGAYTYTGVAATLISTAFNEFILAAVTGVYALTGMPALQNITRLSSVGVYLYTGITDTVIRKTITMTAEAGSYVYSGLAAIVKSTRRLIAATGTYTLTGQAANLFAGLQIRLIAAAGAYVYTGGLVGLRASLRNFLVRRGRHSEPKLHQGRRSEPKLTRTRPPGG